MVQCACCAHCFLGDGYGRAFDLRGKSSTRRNSTDRSIGGRYGCAAGAPCGRQGGRGDWSRRHLLAKQTDIDSVRNLSWSAFELLIGEAYRQQGYEVSESGLGGPDGGVDLRLHRNGMTLLVQCKQWKVWTVGVKPVRELYGVMTAEGAGRAIFVTSGRYTAEAKEFARGKPLELIDGEELMHLIKPLPAEPPPDQRSTSGNVSVQPCPECNEPMVLENCQERRQSWHAVLGLLFVPWMQRNAAESLRCGCSAVKTRPLKTPATAL